MVRHGYNNSIFINCPFDAQYSPILQALIFTICRCGFKPKCSLGEDNGLHGRLEKIQNYLSDCQLGIHDISRVELHNGLPRFNMPFELGIFFGAKRFGNKIQKSKNALIFDVERGRHSHFISDLNGVDIKAHNNDPLVAIRIVRDWLKTTSDSSTIFGHNTLIKDYNIFLKRLPDVIEFYGLDTENILFKEHCQIIEEAIEHLLY